MKQTSLSSNGPQIKIAASSKTAAALDRRENRNKRLLLKEILFVPIHKPFFTLAEAKKLGKIQAG